MNVVSDFVDTGDRCPICKRGALLEWRAGYYCSRRYAPRTPCDFEGGYMEPTESAVSRWRKQTPRQHQ